MAKLKLTKSLKGSLGETYYKELCAQKNWAYCSLEVLYNRKNSDVIVFKKGFDRIKVKIPNSIKHEVFQIAQPSNNSAGNPSFVFDYLACKITNSSTGVISPDSKDFCWAEIKTGLGIFSENQYQTLRSINLKIAVFHVEDINVKPSYVKMDWDIMSGQELARQLSYTDNDDFDNNKYGKQMISKYDSICYVCGYKIRAGKDRIVQSNSNWIHVRCKD